MKQFYTFFILTLFALQASAQNVGDYRSNVTTTGTWATPASWEVYDGATWVTATAAPSSTDRVITIRNGDSIRLNNVVTIDEVVIESGGVLAIFSTGGTVTVADGAGDDIVVNGRLYTAALTTVTGAAGSTILVNPGGLQTIRNSANFQVNTTNNGSLHFGQPGISGGTVTNATITATGNIEWIDGNILLNNASIVNSGAWQILPTGNLNLNSIGTTSITNSGTIEKLNAAGVVTIAPAFTNTGTIRGTGTINFSALTNNGTVDPGTPTTAAVLTTSSNALSANSTVSIQLYSSPTPGTGQDQLNFTTNTTLNGTLTVNEIDPEDVYMGVFTIMSTTGTFSGAFTTVNLPSNFNYLGIVGGNQVQVEKIAVFPLPLKWGSFSALSVDNKVVLNWTTLQEANTSHFVVEHSFDGRNFTAIGNLAAAGNSEVKKDYSFTHNGASTTKNHYYRILQVDIDNKKSYSEVRVVRFNQGKPVSVVLSPNPVRDMVQISVQVNEITVQLVDDYGRTLRNLRLQPGVHTENLSNLPAGTYSVVIYQGQQRIETKRIVKQ